MLMVMGGLFVILLSFDMGIKQYIESTYKEKEEHETMIDKVVFRKVYNKGFILNALDKYPRIIKGVSVSSGAGIILYDIWLFIRKGRLLKKLGMVFLSAGAASNIYDRLERGKVIDYIGVKSRNKFLSRLTANLADMYVALGAVFIGFTK
ncbi:signal peptidase II [Lachnospiraceae bacterium 42-17]|jgi:signal peptidase II